MQEAKPPDGGWGWVIGLCSFVNHALMFGTLFSLGVLYVSWLEEFENSKSTTSWIISICASLAFLSGPIAGSLAAKYGYRFTATLGGFLAAIGLILSYFATSVLHLIITLGVITGSSCGFVYLSSLAIVVVYFDKKRALASGIGVSGVGIGTFCLSQLMNALAESYGWRGCLLILGGLLLNLCVTGALMRPLVFKDSTCGMDKNAVAKEEGGKEYVGNQDVEKLDGKTCEGMTRYDVEGLQITIGVEREETLRQPGPSSTDEIDYRENPEGMFSRKDSGGVFRGNDNNMTTTCAEQDVNDHEVLITRIIPHSKKHSKTDNRYDLDSCDTSANNTLVRPRLTSHSDENIPMVAKLNHFNFSSLNELVLLSSSAPTLRTISPYYDRSSDYSYSHSKSLRKSTSKMEAVDKKTYSGMHSQQDSVQRLFRLSAWKRSVVTIFLLNIRALKDGALLLFSVSQILLTFSFFTPLIYMVDRAIDDGISKSQATWLISCNGVGSLVGRLLFGLLGDRFQSCSLMLYIALVSLAGVLTMMSPLCGGSIFLHGAYASLFGLGMGGICTLFVVIVVDLVGLSGMATALGILLWFAGIGHLVGPPAAGFIFDVTQSFTICYVAQGFVLTCSGLMLIPIFRIRSGICGNGASRDMTS